MVEFIIKRGIYRSPLKNMEQKIIRTLNAYYYGIMLLAVLVGTACYYLIMKDILIPIDRMSALGKGVQYVVILDALCTIPLGLYLFKRKCSRLRPMPDGEAKWLAYRRGAAWRIMVVSNSMVFGIAAYYLMGCYQSMLWITGVAAIGWIFTKPTLRKMQLELQPEDPQNETY